MNDASPRFAESQTHAASLLSSEEGNLPLAELAQRAVELNEWVTEEGLRGATAGEPFDGYCQRLSAMDVRHHACIRVDPDTAPPMDWLRLHMATRIKIGACAAVCPGSHFAGVVEQPLQCAYPAITRRRKESLVAAPAGTRPRATRLSRARRILRRGRDGLCVSVLSVWSNGRSVARNRRPLFIHD
jgi:hypothetical protein